MPKGIFLPKIGLLVYDLGRYKGQKYCQNNRILFGGRQNFYQLSFEAPVILHSLLKNEKLMFYKKPVFTLKFLICKISIMVPESRNFCI